MVLAAGAEALMGAETEGWQSAVAEANALYQQPEKKTRVLATGL